jgi:hypothetical protein
MKKLWHHSRCELFKVQTVSMRYKSIWLLRMSERFTSGSSFFINLGNGRLFSTNKQGQEALT